MKRDQQERSDIPEDPDQLLKMLDVQLMLKRAEREKKSQELQQKKIGYLLAGLLFLGFLLVGMFFAAEFLKENVKSSPSGDRVTESASE